MNATASSTPARGPLPGRLALLLVVLGGALAFLFYQSFLANQALFSNDGPLGAQMAKPYALPAGFFGVWNDLYWIGASTGSFSPNVTGTLLALLGPVGFNKFVVPLAMLLAGLSAGFYFRQLKFNTLACVLGGVAVGLNMNYFSNACWGLSSRALTAAMAFLALAAFQSSLTRWTWAKTILAGLAVGMAVSEGADNGVFFSLFVAACAFYQCVVQEKSPLSGAGKGIARVAVMALFALLIAAQPMSSFFGFAVKGMVGMEQQTMSKEEKWAFATQWSLPKMEMLRVIIPGIYGYRVDAAEGGNYWGGVGETPGWSENHANPAWANSHPTAIPRHSGAGEYAGVPVVLIALWALVFAFSKAGNPFTPVERKMIWFWAGSALVAALFAWGRHAPFYRIIYALPYFSNIRNPMKFMHVFHLAIIILFGYGLQGLSRRYLEVAGAKALSFGASFKNWWGKAVAVEKRWVFGSVAAAFLGVISFLSYTNARPALARHLANVGFPNMTDAMAIARFSAGEVGLFALFLALSVAAVIAIQSGAFAGRRAKWAGLILGVILVVDLARANAPWILYYNYQLKYSSNPVIDILKAKPWEGRVTAPSHLLMPQTISSVSTNVATPYFPMIYRTEWLEHLFQFYSIQALEVSQEPRMPEDKAAFLQAFATNTTRYWELVNARYVIGVTGFIEALNSQSERNRGRWRIVTTFDVVPKTEAVKKLEDLTVASMPNGPLALFEFTGALPRAKLYSQWQVNTNIPATLATLADAAFDPAQSVLVMDELPAPVPASTNANPGTVEFISYAPRRVELRTQAGAPTVLLLADRFDASWKVFIDGKQDKVLRCNFITRGVYLPAGNHVVSFRFDPPDKIFYVTLGATLFGLLFCGVLAVCQRLDRKTGGHS